ncbi:MAG TPA: hypothetical protein VLE95_06800 [Chlamydiales bacterium]|nr:hypothetical protein [Chlamydiales bacterium]
MKKVAAILIFFSCICAIFFLAHDLKRIKKKLHSFEKLAAGSLKTTEQLAQAAYMRWENGLPEKPLPQQLQKISFADAQGIVLSVQNIDIPGVFAPYNGSLIQYEKRNYLFFRYDIPLINNGRIPFHTYIGCVEMDARFQPTTPFFTLDTQSSFSEDPRACIIDDQCYLVYNDRVEAHRKKRGVQLGIVDLENQKLDLVCRFETRKFAIEKNWMLFAPDDKNLHFIYTVSPYEVCKISSSNQLIEVVAENQRTQLNTADWEDTWGVPRGGTPPVLIDGEYLVFFHSMFQDNFGFNWYVMGAYTFEPFSPYRIKKISPYPILFKGIFSSSHRNTANPKIRSIYPAGFISGQQNGKETIYLSCGENDSAIKIVTFDKEALLGSLKPLK